MFTAQRKKLGFSMLTALVVGNVIGAGIFLLPSSLAAIGSISIFAWIFTSLGTLFLIYVFTDLNRMLPKTGGPYIFSHESFGDFVGFSVAYCYWLAWTVGNAAMTVAAVGYMGSFWPTVMINSLHTINRGLRLP